MGILMYLILSCPVCQETLQHQIETVARQHTESLINVKKQVCFHRILYLNKDF